MNCDQAAELLIEHIERSLEPTVAVELTGHLSACTRCREELDALSRDWALLGALPAGQVPRSVRRRFYTVLESEVAGAQRGTRDAAPARGLVAWWSRGPLLQIGWSLAALIVGLWLGTRIDTVGDDRGELREIRAELQTMSRTVALSLLENRSAGERLRGVGLSRNEVADDEITTALIEVIKRDPNVNVRLAALDVLGRHSDRNDVQSGLLDAFAVQNSSTMQVALAGVLAGVSTPESTTRVEEVLRREDIPAPIRDQLRQALLSGGERL